MTEKTLLLPSGRSVKVTAMISSLLDPVNENISFDVMIRNPLETHFHPPIEQTHPKFWKLQRLAAAQQSILQLQYSGLSKRQIKNIISVLKGTVLYAV
jgi:hypothetical protein